MKSGGEDEVRVAMPGMRPWWRSVGFWLGVPGLVFLVWVWVDSFTGSPAAMARMRIGGQGFYAEMDGPELYVQRGMVFYRRSRALEASPGVWAVRDKERFQYRWGGFPAQEEADGVCGYESLVRTLEVPPGELKMRVVRWWFPVWFLVAGYGVVWMGWMMMWRWWVRRRWRVERGEVC